jgi:hypothetical protein
VTVPGEFLWVLGDIEEMGRWKEHKCRMTWTTDHVWEIKDVTITSRSFFNYKYVLEKDGKFIE